MKVKAILSYDGSYFGGSAPQIGQMTAYSHLDFILQKLNISSKIEFASRTDKGVHALGQCCSFDLPYFWTDLDKLKNCINKLSQNKLQILDMQKINNSFHPRYNAKARSYRYMITNKQIPPFYRNYIVQVKDIDMLLIKECIKFFVGEHDFSFFKKNGSNTKYFVRNIQKAYFYKYKNFYVFYFKSNGFLRSQVRMMVAFLLKISEGTLSKKQLLEQINVAYKHNVTLAPPNGLYLTDVFFS